MENIRAAGEDFIGRFIEDWDNTFDNLTDKGVIKLENEEYFLTDLGIKEYTKLQDTRSLWLYAYNKYFDLAEKSEAHKKFCQNVYGHSFSQHGMADKHQLDKLIEVLKLNKNDRVLDLGSGNGLISEYIQKNTGAYFSCIDFSKAAIDFGKDNIVNEKITFQEMDMNKLEFEDNSFNSIISIDTLYFVKDLEKTIDEIFRILKPGGKFGFFYSEEIETDDEDAKKGLLPDNTPLARKLLKNGIEYNYFDLCENEDKHWKDKFRVLGEMKKEFEEEGSHNLFNFRYGEAKHNSSYSPEQRSRFLYYFSK